MIKDLILWGSYGRILSCFELERVLPTWDQHHSVCGVAPKMCLSYGTVSKFRQVIKTD